MNLPQPIRGLQTQAAGWWKAPSSLGTDPSFLRLPDETRLAAIALHTCAIGWCLNHDARDGWIPAAAVQYGQVVAAPPSALLLAADGLVDAGLWTRAEKDGLSGYVVAGAATSVEQRFARQESARQAGITSAASRPVGQPKPSGRNKIDPNQSVDWSKESTEL
jgi:hypothetical protein